MLLLYFLRFAKIKDSMNSSCIETVLSQVFYLTIIHDNNENYLSVSM